MNRVVRGVRTSALFELAGKIIEPMPIDRRGDYGLFRGVSLGALCLNWIDGRYVLNAPESETAFVGQGPVAYRVARNHMAANGPDIQLKPPSASRLAELLDSDLPCRMPAMVVGVRMDHGLPVERISESQLKVCGNLDVGSIDPYSADALVELFGVPLDRLEAQARDLRSVL